MVQARERRYRFRFADVFLPGGLFAETFLVADFVRVRAAGFRLGSVCVGFRLPIFVPAIPPTTSPTAAPIGPRSDPTAAPATAPPAVPRLAVVSPDFVSASLVFSISLLFSISLHLNEGCRRQQFCQAQDHW